MARPATVSFLPLQRRRRSREDYLIFSPSSSRQRLCTRVESAGRLSKCFPTFLDFFFSFFGREPNSSRSSRSKLGNPDNVSRGYTSRNSNFLGSANAAGTARHQPRQVGINPVEVMVVVHPPAQEMKRSFLPFSTGLCVNRILGLLS